MIAPFLSGAVFLGCLACALFFLRFWRRTRDRLFFMFALAFLAFAIERIFIGLSASANELSPYVYLLRLCGFLLIIYGIVEKNRK
jgi:hypothetical protein